jgi:phenylalanyl-tRNA synthetase beta chain
MKVRAAELRHLQPGRSAEVLVGGQVVGWVGEVHPAVLEAFDVEAPVTAFQLDLAAIVREAADARPYSDVPRYPGVELDVALVVTEDVTAERVEQAMTSAGGSLLESVRLFDVYRGHGVPDGSKSLAVALIYRASDRTLTAEEVESVHQRLVRKVTGVVGGALRG